MSPLAAIVHCLKTGASRFQSSRAAKSTSARSSHNHVQVCPPDIFPAGSLGKTAQDLWARTPWGSNRKRGALNELFMLRDEFTEAIEDIQHADGLRIRIERARSRRELWHLRASVFNAVAQQYNQDEATKRLAHLNRHFPTRSSHHSGFTPLFS